MQTLVALYHNFSDAQNAVDELVRSGVDRSKISIVANNATGEYSNYVRSGEDAVTAEQGAAFGAASGGIIGALVGLGALAIPGIGPVIAAGPLIAALAGGAVGALAGAPTGGLVAGLVKTHHIDEDDAELYAEGVRRGETLVTVQVEDASVSSARDILNTYNPTDVHGESSSWRESGWQKFDETATPYSSDDVQSYRTQRSSTSTGLGATGMGSTSGMTETSSTASTRMDDGKMVLPVVEEQVNVSKQQVEKGRVHVYTEVSERPVQTDVTLREENVTVERRPVDRAVNAGDAAFQEQSIELTERAERAVIDKSARVVEEVIVGKEATERTETVSDTVRRTDVRVEEDATNFSAFSSYDTDFRTDYQTRYGSTGRQYDIYLPAYQYGYTLASDETYRDRDWNTFESDARTRWERDNPDTLWDDVKDAARYAWDKVRGRR